MRHSTTNNTNNMHSIPKSSRWVRLWNGNFIIFRRAILVVYFKPASSILLDQLLQWHVCDPCFQNLNITFQEISGRLIPRSMFPNHWMDEAVCQILISWNSQLHETGSSSLFHGWRASFWQRKSDSCLVKYHLPSSDGLRSMLVQLTRHLLNQIWEEIERFMFMYQVLHLQDKEARSCWDVKTKWFISTCTPLSTSILEYLFEYCWACPLMTWAETFVSSGISPFITRG